MVWCVRFWVNMVSSVMLISRCSVCRVVMKK